jgi:hypothetical protein
MAGTRDMEHSCSLERKANSTRVISSANLRRLLDALGIGLLLGVLVNVPYDQLFGLSDTLQYAVQSMITIFAFASLLSNWPKYVTVEQARLL